MVDIGLLILLSAGCMNEAALILIFIPLLDCRNGRAAFGGLCAGETTLGALNGGFQIGLLAQTENHRAVRFDVLSVPM